VGLILDSSVVITAERLGRTARQIVEEIGQREGDTEIAISVVTALEMAHGLTRANTLARRVARQRFLVDLLAGMPVYPVSLGIALRAGQIDGKLQAEGKRVPLADLLIGVTALDLGYSVATGNVRHFEMIPNLEVKRI
jgi:predicted nucleic acid-binding protein